MFDFWVDKRKYVRYNPYYKNKCSRTEFRYIRRYDMEYTVYGRNAGNSNALSYRTADCRYNRKKVSAAKKSAALKKYILTVLTIVVVLFVISGAINSNAGSMENQKYKYYAKIVIQEGDTLWSIADEYRDPSMNTRASYISEVKSINHIKDADQITAGKILIVPYYSTEYIDD